MFLSVYLFVSPCIPCPGLPQTFFPLCLKYDLFKKTILPILNMLSIDHAFCERLYLCDFKSAVKGGSPEQLIGSGTGNLAKIQSRMQKYHVPAPKNAKRHA